jgi:hypothetical protein
MLFAEADLPPVPQSSRRAKRSRSARRVQVPAARPSGHAYIPVDAVRCGIEARPARPEIDSAHYWHEQKMLATDEARRRECHEKMILSVLALDRSGRPQ